MDIEESIDLFHRLCVGKRNGVELKITSEWGKKDKFNFSYTVHANKDEISRLMAMAVKETGVKLEKYVNNWWQGASGSKGNISLRFYPNENSFANCKLVKKTKTVIVKAQPAVEEHEEEKVYYEAVCENGEDGK